MTAAPCAYCGTAGGYTPRQSGRPLRRSGDRFGISGTLCHGCFRNLAHRTARTEKPRPKLTAEQSRAVEVHQRIALEAADRHAVRWPGLKADLRSAACMGLIEAAIGYTGPFDWDNPVQFIAFAARRIRGACIDLMRNELGRYNKRPATGPMEFAPSDDGPIGWEIDSLDTVDGLIGKLPKNLRPVFNLQYRHGLTITEASERLGLSISWVHLLNKEGLNRFRKMLTPETYDRRASA